MKPFLFVLIAAVTLIAYQNCGQGLKSSQVGSLPQGSINGGGVAQPPPPNPGTPQLVSISAGSSHTCARSMTGKIGCWGLNLNGRLGDGTEVDSPNPVGIQGIDSAVEISAGFGLSCARFDTGRISCWGFNNLGQLGNGSTQNSSVPVNVSNLTNVAGLAQAGYGFHNCSWLSNGRVMCWGANDFGQLGDDSVSQRTTPVQVSQIDNATGVSVADGHSCARLSTGKVMCWGDNFLSQLGNGTQTNSPRPVFVSGIENATAVSTGGGSSCALLATGQVMCWGNNSEGQVGSGSTSQTESTPRLVSGITNANNITSGFEHHCALLSDGQVMCWGYGGMLGNGTQDLSRVPVRVQNIERAVEIDAGSQYTCARESNGQLKCWGSNALGNFGNGIASTTLELTPVLVNIDLSLFQ